MDENIESLFKARMTIFEMLSDRGYTFEKLEMDKNIDQFYYVYKNLTNMFGLTIQAYKSNKNIILIFFPLEMKLRVNSIRSMLEKTKYVGAKHIIIVYPGVVTTFTKQHLNTYYNTALRVEQFCVKALQFNVTKHRLVPPHSVLSKEEQQKICKQLKVVPAQFSRIYTSDPVAQYYGIKAGQLMKIVRSSPEGFEYDTYRYCIRGQIGKK